jgi:hypothetical protein
MKTLYIIKVTNLDNRNSLYKLEMQDSTFKITTKYAYNTIIFAISEYTPDENELTLEQAHPLILQKTKRRKLLDINHYNGDLSDLEKIIEKYIKKNRIASYQNIKPVIELSEKTKQNYSKIIEKLKSLNINVNKITTDEINKIASLPLQYTTKGNYFCALKNYMKINNSSEQELKLVDDKIQEVAKYKINTSKSNELSKVQKDNLISYKTLLEINNKLQAFFQTTQHGQIYSILTQLYVFQPPRRILDYSELYYKPNIEIVNETVILWEDESKISKDYLKVKIDCSEVDKNKNYFGKYKGVYMFVFNRYKTYGTYKVQYIEVNQTLGENILNYISTSKINQDEKIFRSNEVSFKEKVNKIFQIYTNKKIGPSMLRHIYIIDLLRKPNISINTKEIIGMKMGHNISMQAEYNKIVDPNFLNSMQLVDNPKEIDFMGNNKPKEKKRK